MYALDSSSMAQNKDIKQTNALPSKTEVEKWFEQMWQGRMQGTVLVDWHSSSFQCVQAEKYIENNKPKLQQKQTHDSQEKYWQTKCS